MNTQTSGKDTPRLHIAILGSSDFCRKMDSYITTARLAEKSFSASFSGAWELLSSHRPNVILLEIGTHYSESVHSWTRHFLSQVRERYGSEIFIITALLSPAHLGYGGDLLFEDETLHGSSFIDTFIAAPPSNIPSVTPLNAQLQNALSFCQEELQRRAEGQSALPTLNSNGWAQSLADPRSRELWMVWVPRYAKYTNENPIIIGETGTGKTNLALALHLLAGRSGKFISITPRDFSSSELIQAELFGAVEGAYTGAVDKWGLVKSAEKGTLFIDELQSIDKALQGKLITFIESKVYRRVGSTETTSADVRFVFASNEALFDLMDCDVLRHDFAYRLERVSLELPPLRERRLDIAAGLAYAIAKIHRQRAHNSRIFGISNDAYRLLFSHSWPGNLRQLENSTAKLCEMADFKGSSIIDAADVGKVFESKFFGKAVTSSEILAEAALDLAQRALSKPISSLQDGVSEFTTLVRSHALEATGGDLNLAAEKIADHAPLMTFVASNIIATKESEVKP
ncbi:MAG: sigma 54-interacting transcriptional regulator [Bdellovibrionota bacterium]|jgi:DNA-binding NtrC family response regulator